MTLLDKNFLTFGGEPVQGRTPAKLKVLGDNPISDEQYSELQYVYGKFGTMKNLSISNSHDNGMQLSDGSQVRIRSAYGVDEVTIEPAPSGDINQLRLIFKAVPSSVAHPWGYDSVVTDPPNYVMSLQKASKEWQNYQRSNPPQNLQNPVGIDQHPGAVTWMNVDIKYRNVPVVLSWYGPQHRYGDFRSDRLMAGDPVVGYLYPEDPFFVLFGPNYRYVARERYPNKLPAQLPSEFEMYVMGQNKFMRAAAVWINGAPLAFSGSVQIVYSAALRKSGADIYLRVLGAEFNNNNLYVYEKKLIGETALPGWGALLRNGASVVLTSGERIASFAAANCTLGSIPYFNKSATKLVALFYLGSPRAYSISEFDIATNAFATPPVLSTLGTLASGVSGSSNHSVLWLTTDGFDWHAQTDTWTRSSTDTVDDTFASVLAVDYVDDTPTYVYLKSRRVSSSSWSYSGSSTTTSASETGTHTATSTTTYELHHSTAGLLATLGTDVITSGGSSTATHNSGTQTITTTRTVAGTWPAFVWGDLRYGNFITVAPLATTATLSYTRKSEVRTYASNVLVSTQTVDNGIEGALTVTTSTTSTPGFPPVASGFIRGVGGDVIFGYTIPTTPGTTHQHVETSDTSFTNPPVASPLYPPAEYECPADTILSVAKSPVGKWDYITWSIFGTRYSRLTKDGAAVTMPDYAPGTNPTLIHPIFLGPR